MTSATTCPTTPTCADLRSFLYGLHAILRLHTVQEDDGYLSLGDDTGAAPERQQPLTCLGPVAV